ncbi:MADS-box transcription factor 1-like [Lolium rigidum]|uniref:MADS-box transcription factor 1-like n=1 Tax=Lolium rigidum TaxID=89674 RepID=UPI001F5DF2B3|nr:MADS-box transcription factor 1-like [Lolium rigidum]
MYKTLERYRTCNNSHEANPPLENEISYHEYLKLKTRVEFLQSSQRNILGEDLGPLSIKELDQIENQIDVSLKHIRSRKSQELADQLSDLKNKDQNKDLRKKLQDSILEKKAVHMSWQDGGQNSGHANEPYLGLLQHPDHDSTMQIGYHHAYMDQLNNENIASHTNPNGEPGSSAGWI